MIVKEMVASGNYFLPTVNGVIDFDKPLLSHWLMLPFVWTGGLTEAMLRIPGTLAGLGTVVVVFRIGRRLYGWKAGFFAGALLLVSPLFVFWCRVASAEILNTFSIWLMLWAFAAARFDGRKGYLIFFYAVGAVASFLKGPVAPAVALFTVSFSSLVDVCWDLRETGWGSGALWQIIKKRFFWVLSYPGVSGIMVGIVLFGLLLLLPVFATGSWYSVSMMWKENVVRFFAPFDHDDSALSYVLPVLTFCGPWAFLMIASLLNSRWRKAPETERWTLAVVVGIALFFALSGSRRSYYILPLIPGLALIAGRGVSAWIGGGDASRLHQKVMGVANGLTLLLLCVLSAALFYIYGWMPDYRHVSEILVAAYIVLGACIGIASWAKGLRAYVVCVMMIVMFIANLWGFTVGMRVAERYRTLPDFARKASAEIDKAGDQSVALFQGASSIVLFYMDRKPHLTEANTFAELEAFQQRTPTGLVVIDLSEVPENMKDFIGRMTPVVRQTTHRQSEESFALLQLPGLAATVGARVAPSANKSAEPPPHKKDDPLRQKKP